MQFCSVIFCVNLWGPTECIYLLCIVNLTVQCLYWQPEDGRKLPKHVAVPKYRTVVVLCGQKLICVWTGTAVFIVRLHVSVNSPPPSGQSIQYLKTRRKSYVTFFPMTRQSPVGQGLVIIEASRSLSLSLSLSHTHTVGLLWTSDQSDAETSTWQHKPLRRDIHDLGGIRTRSPSKRAVADPRLGACTIPITSGDLRLSWIRRAASTWENNIKMHLTCLVATCSSYDGLL